MADLPYDRTVCGEPAFACVGVDYFGPFYIKRGRSTVNRYGVMIRTIRKVLYGLLHTQVIHLDDEGLTTLFCEVESIVNSRPINGHER